MNKMFSLSIVATGLTIVALVYGSEVPGREEVLIGSCRCEIHVFEPWRRLDKSDRRFELTNMNATERVRGTIVPRGRHLVQLGCDKLRQPFAAWLRSTEAELEIPSHSHKREIEFGVGANRLRAIEIEWEQNELQSTYWLFSKNDRVFVIHFFGWSEDSRRMNARMEVLKLLGELRVLPEL